LISLIKAVRLMGFNDDVFVWFCTKHGSFQDTFMSVGNMRRYLDMKNIKVKHIYSDHLWTCNDISWEFLVSDKDFKVIKHVRKVI